MIGPEVALLAPIGTVVEPGFRKRKRVGIDALPEALGAASAIFEARAKWQCKLSEQPVKAHFLEIVLRHLEELGLDLHLARWSCHLRFDQSVNEVEVGLSILDDQPAGAGNEVGARTGRKGDPLGLQKLSRT